MNSYRATYNKIESYFKDKSILQITKRDYQNFLNHLGELNAKETNRKLNGYIRTCLKEAIDEELIKKDFTQNVTYRVFQVKPNQKNSSIIQVANYYKNYTKITIEELKILC